MRHRSPSNEYNFSRIFVSTRDQAWKEISLIKGKGHVSDLGTHSDFGNGIAVWIWDETEDRDEDGDLKGIHLTVRGTNTVFSREECSWSGWMNAGVFAEEANNLLVEAGLQVTTWTWVRVQAVWWQEAG